MRGLILRIKDGPPESADAVDYFFGGFQDHYFLTGTHADDCVGSGFDLFDLIRIQDDRGVIEPCDMDHNRVSVNTSAVPLVLRERYPVTKEKIL
jgi:hypothetical protein